MSDFSTTVSHMIENQFPAIYREEGEELVAFTKAYYEFLEETDEYSVKLTRQMFDANDIDDSLEKFITHFKQKYMADLPFTSATDKRFMIKHIMDLYRSKGSQRSLELFMRLMFNEEVDIYLPGKDMLRASDSEYYRPVYLEVSKSPRTRSFINKQITGTKSGATAFVEGIATKRISGKHIDVLYLSSVRGTFKFNERITDDGLLAGAPIVNGSLTDIAITIGGRNNVVGDIFDVISPNGTQGKIRITAVENATGRVDFEIISGGYGYTNTSDATASEVFVSTALLDIDNTDTRYQFVQYENVVQRIETINTLSATDINGALPGDFVVGINGSGGQVANGVVISVANTDANGSIISLPSANSIITLQALNDTTFGDQKVIATIGSAAYAVGEIVEEQSKVTLTISTNVGTFVVGQIAQQLIRDAVSNNIIDIAFGTITSANSTSMVLEPSWGTFNIAESIEQQSNSSITAFVTAASTLPVDAGARAIVTAINGANVTINDLFGTFNVANNLRGKSTRLIDEISTVSTTGASDLWLNGINTANGIVDLVANNYASGIVVGQNTTSIGIFGNTSPFHFKVGSSLSLETIRDTMFSVPVFDHENPSYEYIADGTFSRDAVITNTLTAGQRGSSAIFKMTTTFPSPLVDGTLMECGGLGDSVAITLIDSIANPGTKRLVLMSGDGALSPVATDRAELSIEAVDLPLNLSDNHEIQVHLDPPNGTIELWINGVSKGTANTSDGSPYTLWSDTEDGGYGIVSGNVHSGASLLDWEGTLISDLEYFEAVPNVNSVVGSQLDINRVISDIKTGIGADFDIGFLENTEIVNLNVDLVSANNVVDIPFAQVLLTGEGSGIGFIASTTVDTGGTLYSNGSIVTFTGGGFGGGDPFIAAEGSIITDAGGVITSITMTNPGEGYFFAPVPALPATGGTVATVTPVMDFGYGFMKLPNGDDTTFITDCLTNDNFTIGTIASLSRINPGVNYNADPFVVVRNKFISSFGRRNFFAEVDTLVGNYSVGEALTQDVGGGSTAKGNVISFTNNNDGTGTLLIERTSFSIAFLDSVAVSGAQSGATSNIVSLTNDESGSPIGENAIITGTVIAADGIATGVDVVDSGYGYSPGEPVSLSRVGFDFIIEGDASVINQGISEGYWRTTTSHLNSEKKLQDSKYFQEYSYDVISGISLNRYKDALKDVLHVAGNELFGSITKKSLLDSQISIADSSVEIV
ncbi:MAG: hypothetical protein COA84_13160 [Robiginitomaculum sp.]|nr:MAG: hypothetical protein COA84_13160 [Robiginitomaculum sp.]